MKNLQHLLLRLALAFAGCDPAQEIPTDFNLPKCSVGEERYVEFTNIMPVTFTLPPIPDVGCGVTYAIMAGAAVTFSGGDLSIKGDSQPASTSFVRTTAGTGRLTWNGLHWVHLGGG